PEELEHLLVLDARHLRRGAAAAHRLRGADVDDGVALLVDQAGEVGQLARLRQHQGAEHGEQEGNHRGYRGSYCLHLQSPKTTADDTPLRWRCAARSPWAPRPPRSPRDWRLRGCTYGWRPCWPFPGAPARAGLRPTR